ncbi:hypothetical protein [Candidatus Tisiphia endosymbiont of Beris chalybata]|uniref:hypothetical protein n=1 Tax=Candidatus Tisiphia endosymbiont of Beris chalybata TaxID=3066262 RepID=UPI00312CA865
MTNIHYNNLLKLEDLQKKYSLYEEKIKEKNRQSNPQKAQITYAQDLMNLSLAEYQDKFCLQYTNRDHQAMIIQQQEICKRLENSILENNREITEYLQKLRELTTEIQDYNYLLVLSNYAKEILQLRHETSELKERISSVNYHIACHECYVSEEPYFDDNYGENNHEELKYLEEELDLRRNKLVEMELKFRDEKLQPYSYNFLDNSALPSIV